MVLQVNFVQKAVAQCIASITKAHAASHLRRIPSNTKLAMTRSTYYSGQQVHVQALHLVKQGKVAPPYSTAAVCCLCKQYQYYC